MPTRLSRGSALTIAAAVVAVAGLLWAGTTAFERSGEGPSASAAGTTPAAGESKLPKVKKRLEPTPSELRAALVRTYLTPKLLAASGVSAVQVTTLVSNGRQYLTDHSEDISLADAAFASAQSTYDGLYRKVQQRAATPEERQAFEAAISTLASARAARDTALAAFKAATVAGIGEGTQSTISTIVGNKEWKIPTQYLAVNRTPRDWVRLREALANDRQASAHGAEPDPGCHQRVVEANAAVPTSTAADNLANHLAEVTAAFDAAVRGG